MSLLSTEELRAAAGIADSTYRRARAALLASGEVALEAAGGGRAKTNRWVLRDALVTPRSGGDGETVAVRLIEALRQRAVVMWRTHADTMPDEAAALSVSALADLHDAAEHAEAPWTLLLDEFGAVIKMAAARGIAILQRGHPARPGSITTQRVADGPCRHHPACRSTPAREPDRQLRRHRRAPPTESRVARLAGKASGHPRALVDEQPVQRPRQPTHRARERPPGQRVPHRLGRIQRSDPRRGGDLHAARGQPTPRAHRPGPPSRRAAGADRPRGDPDTRARSQSTPRTACTTPRRPPTGRRPRLPSGGEDDPDYSSTDATAPASSTRFSARSNASPAC